MVVFVYLSWSWPWRAAFSLQFKVSVITETLRKSVLFYASDLGFIASQYVDRYLVSLFLGMNAAGLYFLLWTVANAATAFLGLVLGQKQRPLLITSYRTGGLVSAQSADMAFFPDNNTRQCGAQHRRRVSFSNFLTVAKPGFTRRPLACLLVDRRRNRLSLFGGLFGGGSVYCTSGSNYDSDERRVGMVFSVLAQLLFLPVAGLYGAGGAILITFAGISLWRYWLLFGFSLERPRSRQAQA